MIPQHSSATPEHYTPVAYVEAAREVLGRIVTDPASCALAQQRIRAERWYGHGSPFGEDGLANPWVGEVLLNPPGGKEGKRSSAAFWWATLVGAGNPAIFVGFTLEILRSAQTYDCRHPLEFPVCVPAGRVAFDVQNEVIEKKRKRKGGTVIVHELRDPSQPEGVLVAAKSPPHANVIVYTGPDRDRFVRVFSQFGVVR